MKDGKSTRILMFLRARAVTVLGDGAFLHRTAKASHPARQVNRDKTSHVLLDVGRTVALQRGASYEGVFALPH